MSTIEPIRHSNADGDHVYPNLFGWHCNVHNRVCSPFKPVTVDDLLKRAANDSTVDDATFQVLARALDGDEIVPRDGEL